MCIVQAIEQVLCSSALPKLSLMLLKVSLIGPITSESCLTSRLITPQLWSSMNCSEVVSQVPSILFSLSTFITFGPCSNAMFRPHVSTLLTLFSEDSLTSRLRALEHWSSMHSAEVLSQQAKTQLSLPTLLTFYPCTNAMLHPHVSKVGLPPRKLGSAVWIFASQFGRTMNKHSFDDLLV